MSLRECEVARGSPNQLVVMPNYTALAPEQYYVPHHTCQVACLPFRNSRDSLRNPSQVYRNTNFSTGTRGKLRAPHNV